jgi:hypothetical protein
LSRKYKTEANLFESARRERHRQTDRETETHLRNFEKNRAAYNGIAKRLGEQRKKAVLFGNLVLLEGI